MPTFRFFVTIAILAPALAQSPAVQLSEALELLAERETERAHALLSSLHDAPELSAAERAQCLYGLTRSAFALGDEANARKWAARLHQAAPEAFVSFAELCAASPDDAVHAVRAGLSMLCVDVRMDGAVLYLHNGAETSLVLVAEGSHYSVRGHVELTARGQRQVDFDGDRALAREDLSLAAGEGRLLRATDTRSPVFLLAWRAAAMRERFQPPTARRLRISGNAALELGFAAVRWGADTLEDVVLVENTGPALIAGKALFVSTTPEPLTLLSDAPVGPGSAISVGAGDNVAVGQRVVFTWPDGLAAGEVASVDAYLAFVRPIGDALPTVSAQATIFCRVVSGFEPLAATIASLDGARCSVAPDADAAPSAGQLCVVYRGGRAIGNLVLEAEGEDGRWSAIVLAVAEGWELTEGDRLVP